MILAILILYILSVVGIGIYCRKKTSTVNDFVLGGRSVGPWFTAFAYGTSYFSAVILSAMQANSAGTSDLLQPG